MLSLGFWSHKSHKINLFADLIYKVKYVARTYLWAETIELVAIHSSIVPPLGVREIFRRCLLKIMVFFEIVNKF